jgi:hypothetical protein
MRHTVIAVLSAVLIFSGFSICFAEMSHIGIVKSVNGEALIVRNSTIIKATPSAKLLKGDMLETKKGGSMGLIFEDDTVVSMGPDSKVIIEDFIFQPGQKKMSFVAKLVKGTISYLSGQIAKLSPEQVRLETPDATIGTRGTHVLLKAC